MKTLNTSLLTFLVVFHAKNDSFIVQLEELGKLIKEHSKYGIESIKLFDRTKGKFNKISKEKLTLFVEYNTEAIEELKRVNYIKK